MSELRIQMDRVYNENASLNKQKAELEVRVEHLTKEIKSCEARLEGLRMEKAEQDNAIDELQDELGM